MEVFMHNLPFDLSEEGLSAQLEPFMKQLAIVNYTCTKPRKKRIGFIIFLSSNDGQRFLAHHGEVNTSQGSRLRRSVSKLQFLKTDIFCKVSERKPSDIAIESLKFNAEQRGKEKQLYDTEKDDSMVVFRMKDSSCGYCTFIGDHLAYVPEVKWQYEGTMRFTKRNIVVKMGNITIRIPIKTVVHLVWFTDGSLTFTLSTVPLFFSDLSEVDRMIANLFLNFNVGGTSSTTSDYSRRRLCSLRNLGEEHAKVVGQCLVYQFNVSSPLLNQKIDELKKLELTVTSYEFANRRTLIAQEKDFITQMKALEGALANYTQNNSLPFAILFQLQALAQNAYLLPCTVLRLAQGLSEIFSANRSAGKRPWSVDSIKRLFDTIDWPFPHGDPLEFEVDSLLETIRKNMQEMQDTVGQRNGAFSPSQNITPICRAMVTPSRITLHGPEMEPGNRILRKFPNHHDYFIRVQFCDENGEDLRFNPRVNNDDIFSRFENILKTGIMIAGRTYTFLGFSHSSLRSHSVWFSAPFIDHNGDFQTYFTIIKALGNFSHITSPARCAARIGQAFSETPFTVNLKENEIRIVEIPDVKSDNGLRVFSDGVGTVSAGVMETIWDNIPSKKGSPTCFQIRLGGAKGMVAVDTRLSGSVVQIRPSMIKFNSEDMQDLEICDMASEPIPLFLNRQMIKIMEDMNIPERWFVELQNNRVTELREVTANIKNTAKFLKRHNVGGSIQLYKLFNECNQLQVDYKEDPFLRSLVEVAILRELRLVKHRARIPVEKGITLFGIMDETGYLLENQVYVTFDTMEGRFPPPPGAGMLLVTRSPALFDGDIQLASNIVPPKHHPLNRHRNCIVFSQRGTRDMPSQLSGGDLDGDIFNIVWDTAAIPQRIFPPADYPRVDPVDIGRLVTKEDMAKFFVEFMKTDRLGIIATKHMILADWAVSGSSHPDCRTLARLHSTAVDFSKTGIPARLEEIPKMHRYRPDFLAPGPQTYIHDKSEIEFESPVKQSNNDEDDDSGPSHKYYRSKKILGKLYRAVDEKRIWYEDVRSNRGGTTVKPFWEEFLRSCTERCNVYGVTVWFHRFEEARNIRSAYEDAIFSAMENFSEHPIYPISELEVFTGHILNKTGVQTHRQRQRSIKLKDEFERIATWIMGQMRQHENNIPPLTEYKTELDSLQLCLACVHAGGAGIYWDGLSATSRRWRDKARDLKSFRVVAACALLAELNLFERGGKRQRRTITT